jgi:hypothetical protein
VGRWDGGMEVAGVSEVGGIQRVVGGGPTWGGTGDQEGGAPQVRDSGAEEPAVMCVCVYVCMCVCV